MSWTTTTVATLREESYAHCAYLLVIDGLKYAFTTDESGDLLGSGVGSWMGADTPFEVLPGLRFPRWKLGVDPVSGMLRTNSAQFQIAENHYNETKVAGLFATEGQEVWTLAERIAPNDSPLTAVKTSNTPGGTDDLSGKAIGLETIRPTQGTRRYYFCFPGDHVEGFDHPVCGDDLDLLAPIPITDEPVQFAGRWCALYRIYKDHRHGSSNGYENWPTWTNQYNGGGLCWWGKMKDAGTCSPDKIWTLQCSGPESFLKKKLNTFTTNDWYRVRSPLILDDGANTGVLEDRIAIHFEALSLDPNDWKVFHGKHFRDADLITDGVSKATLVSQLDGFMNDAVTGSNCNYTPAGGHFDDYDNCDAEIVQSGITIRKDNRDSGNNPTVGQMFLAMHEKVWKFLGYEPEEQNVYDPEYRDPKHIYFRRLVSGSDYQGKGAGDVPGEGYWEGKFETIYPGVAFDWTHCNLWDSNEIPRKYEPLFPGGISVLPQDGGQEIALVGAGSSDAYIEPQLCWPAKNEDVDGTAVGANSVRYFLFRGSYFAPDGEESREMYQVGRCLLRQGTNHGSLYQDATNQPIVWLERWMDPMAFGIKEEPLGSGWAGSNDDSEKSIWAKPLALFGAMPNNTADFAHHVLLRVLLSSGTSTGWTGYWDDAAAPTLDRGDNTHGVTTFSVIWGDDLEIADLGLGIPHELVANPLLITDAFSDAVGGGWGIPLCRGKWIADGPIQSWDLLRSITEPRRLIWTLHGGKFGLIPFAPPSQNDVEVTLTEDALHEPTQGPSTRLRVTDPIDVVHLKYRYALDEESLAEEKHVHARDQQARGRLGDSEITIRDLGLIPSKWFHNREDGKQIQDVCFQHAWEPTFERLWGVTAATLMAKRHFAVKGLVVARVEGQDIFPGTRVRVTNPWVVSSDGTYGITALPGIVTDVSVNTAAETYTCDVLVFQDAVAGQRHFAPIGRVKRIDESGANDIIYLYSDWLDHNDTNLNDAEHFAAPSWDTLGGNAIIRLYHYNRDTWEAGQTGTVSSVDTTAMTITLSGNLSSSYEERDKETLVVMETYDSQTAAWVQGHFGVVVLPNHKHGATPTVGWPYH